MSNNLPFAYEIDNNNVDSNIVCSNITINNNLPIAYGSNNNTNSNITTIYIEDDYICSEPFDVIIEQPYRDTSIRSRLYSVLNCIKFIFVIGALYFVIVYFSNS